MRSGNISSVRLGDYFRPVLHTGYVGLTASISDARSLELFSSQLNIPYRIRSVHRDPVRASLSGFGSAGIAIYKFWTQSALYATSQVAIDAIAVRFVIKGMMTNRSSGRRQDFPAGYALFAPKDQLSELYCSADTEFLALAIDRTRLEEVSNLFTHPEDYRWDRYTGAVPIKASNIGNCQRLAELMMLQVSGGLQDAGSLYPMLEEALLLQLLTVWPCSLRPQRNIELTSSRSVRRALTFIDENLHKPITAGDVAQACGMCIRTLQTSFKREFGYTPSNYILFARLDMVRAEICNLDHAPYISEVAYKWGFRHMGDFSTRYKARFGLTPKEDRERALGERKKVYKLIN